VPGGTYFFYADRVARQAATVIVNEELQDGVAAAARRVLRSLPDGKAVDASGEAVIEQLKALWLLLTSEELADDATELADLETLWTAASGGQTEDEVRGAWRTVLVAIMTHPRFLTY
jgi:hypothetical protein